MKREREKERNTRRERKRSLYLSRLSCKLDGHCSAFSEKEKGEGDLREKRLLSKKFKTLQGEEEVFLLSPGPAEMWREKKSEGRVSEEVLLVELASQGEERRKKKKKKKKR